MAAEASYGIKLRQQAARGARARSRRFLLCLRPSVAVGNQNGFIYRRHPGARRHHQRRQLRAAGAGLGAGVFGHPRHLHSAGRIRRFRRLDSRCHPVRQISAFRHAAGRLGRAGVRAGNRHRSAQRRTPPLRRTQPGAGLRQIHRLSGRRLSAGANVRASGSAAGAAGAAHFIDRGADGPDGLSPGLSAAGRSQHAGLADRGGRRAFRIDRNGAGDVRRGRFAHHRIFRCALRSRRAERLRAKPGDHRRVGGADRRAVSVFRAHAVGQGAARDRRQPPRRATGRHRHHAGGPSGLHAGRRHGRLVRRADRAIDHRLLRQRLFDRLERIRRRDHRRPRQLSDRRGRRAAGRPAGIVCIVLGQRLQGNDRLHADHSGAAVAFAQLQAHGRRGRAMKRFSLPFFIFLAAVILLPLLPTPEFWITLANYIGLYAIVALGLVLLTGVAGLTSFGQAAFVGLGAYSTAYLTTQLGLSPWIGLLAGIAVTALAAFLIGAITMRLSGHYLPLGTIAWGLSLFFLFGNLDLLGKYDGLTGIPPIRLFSLSLDSGREMYFLIWLVLIAAVIAVQNLLDSRPGRAIRALKGGGVMAEAMGVNTAWMKIAIFMLAALLASIFGWLYAHLQRAVNPTPFGLNQGIEYLFMTVVGGAGHVWGAILGATLLTLLKDQLQSILPKLLGANGNFEVIVFGIIMILLLQRAREGLWPYLRKWAPSMRRAKTPNMPAPASVPSSVLPSAPAFAAPLAMRAKHVQGETVLEVDKACKKFGGLVAVNDMAFDVKAGEIMGLIGPNGAGKSTMFNLVSGVLPLTSGTIRFRAQGELRRIDGLPSREIVRRGIARTFLHVRLMPAMSVL